MSKHGEREERICVKCGGIFLTRLSSKKKICSIRCHQKDKVEVICSFCNKQFMAAPSANAKYCSRKCQHLERKKVAEEKRMRTCEICGKVFVMHSQSGRANKGLLIEGRFCSRACRGKWMGLVRKHNDYCSIYPIECEVCGKWVVVRGSKATTCYGECLEEKARRNSFDINKGKKILKERSCMECGKVFTPEYGNKSRLFCSVECCARHSQRNGRHVRRERFKSAFRARVYKREIYKRDGNRCQICGKKANMKAIVPHPLAPTMDHIIPISKGGSH